MKNKLILFLCAAFVMMLCACDSENVNSSSLDNDVVTVSFAVAQEGSPEKIINIDSPLNENNVLYQYKAIASFTSAGGKAPKGSTGDVWTDFPAINNGSSVDLIFAKGNWTLDVRGILKGNNFANDKNDYSLLYQTSAPLNVSIVADSTQIIVFNVEKAKDGIGFADINIIAQGKLEEENPPLLLSFKPIAGGEIKELLFKEPTSYGEYKAIYKADNYKLESGIYLMSIIYNTDESVMGPYTVEIVEKKNTSIEGRIATDSYFVTYFSTEKEEFKYRATFNATAVEKFQLKPTIDKIVAVKAEEKKAVDAKNLLEKAKAEFKVAKVDEQKKLALKQAEKKEISKIDILPDKGERYIDFSLTTTKGKAEEQKEIVDKAKVEINLQEKSIAQEAKQVKSIPEAENLQKKIGIIRQVICNGQVFDLSRYQTNQEGDTIYYSLPEQLFKDVAGKLGNKYSPEQVITLRVEWSNGSKTLVAESDPIVILFLN